jgi:hypothetical protein
MKSRSRRCSLSFFLLRYNPEIMLKSGPDRVPAIYATRT